MLLLQLFYSLHSCVKAALGGLELALEDAIALLDGVSGFNKPVLLAYDEFNLQLEVSLLLHFDLELSLILLHLSVSQGRLLAEAGKLFLQLSDLPLVLLLLGVEALVGLVQASQVLSLALLQLPLVIFHGFLEESPLVFDLEDQLIVLLLQVGDLDLVALVCVHGHPGVLLQNFV